MTLATHAVAGALIGSVVASNPLLAGSLGFASHFLLDAIPHWDYPLKSSKQDKSNYMNNTMAINKSFFFDLIKIGFDVLVGLVVIFLMFKNSPNTVLFGACVGAFFAILPDFLQFVYFQYPKSPIKHLQKFHVMVAHAKTDYNDRQVIGIFFQLALIAIIFFLAIGLLSPQPPKAVPKIPADNVRKSLILELNKAYSSASDAIYGNADNFFVNPTSDSPRLIFSSTSTPEMSLESGRIEVESRLASMKNSLNNMGSTSDMTSALNEINLDLGEIKLFVDNLYFSVNNVNFALYIPKSNFIAWKSSFASARNKFNSAIISVLASEDKLISSQSALEAIQKINL